MFINKIFYTFKRFLIDLWLNTTVLYPGDGPMKSIRSSFWVYILAYNKRYKTIWKKLEENIGDD